MDDRKELWDCISFSEWSIGSPDYVLRLGRGSSGSFPLFKHQSAPLDPEEVYRWHDPFEGLPSYE